MSQEISSSTNQQEILKDIFAGRDLTFRDVKQESIENQINVLVLNIPDSEKTNQEIINAISKAYVATVPDGWFDWRPKETQLDGILTQLKEIPHQNAGISPLLQFVERLVQDDNVPKYIQDKLKELLNVTPIDNSSKYISKQLLHSYLLIQLRPEVNNKVLLKAWFIPDDNVQDEWERFKALTVDPQQTEIPYVPEQIPTLLNNLIKQCYEEHLQGQPTELTVEVFLPRERLCDEVEKWQYIDDENFSITIGTEHCVIVRSYERLKNLRKVQGATWRKNWLKVKQLWKNTPCHEEITTLSQSCFDPNKLRKSLIEKIVLKVCCCLSETERNVLFSAIDSAGTPILLLSRREVQNLKNATEFDKLLNDGSLSELSARLKKQRLAADNDGDEMHLGHHLVLLWDDPNRVPPNPALEFSA